jgi:lipopolysaccharide export system permease protein
MSIVSRYVFRQALAALLLILLSLTGVVWIALALKQLNIVTSQGQDAWRLIAITTLALPNLMALIAPIALLIATIHTLNRLNTDSELIVLTASGATVWTVARPLLLLAAIVALAVASVNHVIMPWSLRELRESILEARTDFLTQVIQPGRFSTPESGVTIHVRDRTHDGVLHGILMHDSRDQKQTLSYLAETGTLSRQDKAAYLTMLKGHILRRPAGDEPVQIIAFGRYAIDLDGFERKISDTPSYKPRELYTHELFAPDTTSPAYKESPGQFPAELHERFANPFYPFAFVLLAVAFIGQAQSTRQRRTETVAAAFGLAAASRIAGFAVHNLTVIKASAAPLMYAVPLGAIALGVVLMRLNARPRRGPSLIARAADAIAARLPQRPKTQSRPGAPPSPLSARARGGS